MKSNKANSPTSDHALSAIKIAAVLMGLISAGSVTWFLNSSPLSWPLPPQTPSDYGNIVLFSLTFIVFCISVWQLGWILLALIAEKSNSLTLRILIHRFGTKWARALLSSSLVITGFSGTAMAVAQPPHSSVTSAASQTYYRPEKPHTLPSQQVSDRNLPRVQTTEISDFTWGANTQTQHNSPSKDKPKTPTSQTYTIVNGDSLWKIAKTSLIQQTFKPSNQDIQRYVIKLYRLNKKIIGPNPNLIYPGMTLTLPLVGNDTIHHKSLEGTK